MASSTVNIKSSSFQSGDPASRGGHPVLWLSNSSSNGNSSNSAKLPRGLRLMQGFSGICELTCAEY